VPVRENEVTVAVGLEHLIDDYGAPLPKHLELLLRRPLIERRTERSKARGWFSLWIWILSPLTSKLMLAANSTLRVPSGISYRSTSSPLELSALVTVIYVFRRLRGWWAPKLRRLDGHRLK
jgi:hypothetical protein